MIGRGRHDHQQGIGTVSLLLSVHRSGCRLFCRRFPGQVKIPIGRHAILAQRDVLAAVRLGDLEDLVIGRLDLIGGKAGGQIDREAHRIERPAIRMLHRRGDARGIGHAIRIERPSVTGGPVFDDDRRAGNVTGSDDHRKAEREFALVISYGLLILDLDDNAVTRSDVGDGGRKDVRPFFFN